uniref:Small ribosomal subunit protein uS4c n=7 Tax=Aneura TaxID=70217 RepID=A0A1Z1G5A2_ANEPI|nr:ribosomal protein S4 [Aneura pinguis]WGO58843.1 ribosomal protein S4 [Aneura pinguis]WGO60735.1 ribosomal protein S4 [Aneura pinguis]WGO60821.1 ribosomal protein S4 [Aneura pinguis]WGO60907.1 ribosomal protein S4 [Aneura pinguis]
MSRYRGPRMKIIRRPGTLPGLTSKTPGSKVGSSDRSTSSKKISQYRIRLEEKQKLRLHYGLTERQLLKYVFTARGAKGSTGQLLLQLLEMRLDNTIFRLGIVPTIPAARQLVNHRHVSINEHIIDIPSYNCKPGDVITINNREKCRLVNMNSLQKPAIPNHLTFDSKEFVGSVQQIIDRDWIYLKINELLVVEYYSRQV